MSYVDRHLTPGESVVFRTRLHPVTFAGTAFFAACVIGIVVLVVNRNDLPADTVRLLWLSGIVIAVGSFVTPVLRWRGSEFAVTTTRVLVKVGLLSVHTLELTLPKIEVIGVDQPIAGRLLGYGTLRIVGPGGTVEEFARVANPDGLRQAVVRQSSRSPAARAR
jgi:uncharacterized membrane protein YdbT with pleckstrin-like domain